MSFPQELCDLVIQHLADDKQALASCSLVCRAWCTTTRPYLFFLICLKNPEPQVKYFIAAFKAHKPWTSPLRHTRTLQIRLLGSTLSDGCGLALSMIPSARTVVFVGDKRAYAPVNLTHNWAFRHPFMLVTELHLVGLRIRSKLRCCQFLSQLVNLRDLYTHNLFFVEEDWNDEEIEAVHLPPLLSCLFLSGSRGIFGLLPWFYDHKAPASLHAVQLVSEAGSPPDMEPFVEFLRYHGRQLTSLAISFHFDVQGEGTSLPLSHVPLRILCLELVLDYESWPTVTGETVIDRILDVQLLPNTLHTLIVDVTPRVTGGVKLKDEFIVAIILKLALLITRIRNRIFGLTEFYIAIPFALLNDMTRVTLSKRVHDQYPGISIRPVPSSRTKAGWWILDELMPSRSTAGPTAKQIK